MLVDALMQAVRSTKASGYTVIQEMVLRAFREEATMVDVMTLGTKVEPVFSFGPPWIFYTKKGRNDC